jgi:phytoene/squalene synthetase
MKAVRPEERSAYLVREARAGDPDRYLCALLAPADRRDALLTLILFNHELARIPDIVSQPMAGMIRLEWWREALDELMAGGPPRPHPVLEALAGLLADGHAAPQALHALIDARESALERMAPDAASLEAYAIATSGQLARIWYAALGGRSSAQADGAAEIGTAFGLVGIAAALQPEAARNTDSGAAKVAAPLTEALQRRAADRLRDGRRRAGRPAREHMSAFLPGALADFYIRSFRRRPSANPTRAASAPLWLAARTLLRWP